MGKPTLRALKRKPQAVVMLAADPSKIEADKPLQIEEEDYDYDWFETDDNRKKFFNQWNRFAKSDSEKAEAEGEPIAYLTAEVVNTTDMKLGRVVGWPKEITDPWVAAVKADPALLTLEPTKTTAKPRVVKSRKKSDAAAVIQQQHEADAKANVDQLKADEASEPADDKKARLAARLAAKKEAQAAS